MIKTEELSVSLHKLMNKLITRSRKFCETSCFADGLNDILMHYRASGDIPEDVMYNVK